VATVWPFSATPEQIKERSIPRVEIFKMPGGTEYIVHDIDENNNIIGKARFSGHVKVSELMSVDGFGGHSIMDDLKPSIVKTDERGNPMTGESESSHYVEALVTAEPPPTFHPPSFGVTVLGNSHGFDKSGSVSGYVLWVNGRGIMIDPPPYSSATLEREGIRPRTIVGIILTHCHADHDAGAFQKVLTGSPVVVITTPTIYKSFIRKYAALSALSPALLRHSHRYKPAVIGQPLRFQGATFHFTYTLHTIPCVGFRVEWRGKSMVFTGDHFNSPPAIDKLQETGVLSKGRADDLRNLPLQDTDLLLHEAGAPPIHTPLDVLLQLPKHVKKRLYVVHTSALPEDCELSVAPTGTKGTIRLDQMQDKSSNGLSGSRHEKSLSSIPDPENPHAWSGVSEYQTISEESSTDKAEKLSSNPELKIQSSFGNLELRQASRKGRTSVFQASAGGGFTNTPLVALRPASSTDAWFILNLLSAVPFVSRYVFVRRLSRLSYELHLTDFFSLSAVCRIRPRWSSWRQPRSMPTHRTMSSYRPLAGANFFVSFGKERALNVEPKRLGRMAKAGMPKTTVRRLPFGMLATGLDH
jgi:glyoxylase-like metal-dependent hydrolase (beta-lactamase superfamily II)